MKAVKLVNSTVDNSITSYKSRVLIIRSNSLVMKIKHIIIAQIPAALKKAFVIEDSVVKALNNVVANCRTFLNHSFIDSMSEVFLSRGIILNTIIKYIPSSGLTFGEESTHIIENTNFFHLSWASLIIKNNAEVRFKNVTIQNCVDSCLVIDETAKVLFEQVTINGSIVSNDANYNYIAYKRIGEPDETRYIVSMHDKRFCTEVHGYKRSINCNLITVPSYQVRKQYNDKYYSIPILLLHHTPEKQTSVLVLSAFEYSSLIYWHLAI